MAVGCKLWLLAVVYVAFLYQDGPQGNGVLCARKPVPESDEDQSFGAVSSDDGNDEQDDDNDDQSDSGNNSDGDYTGNNRKRFSGDDDDNDDDVDADVYADKESNSDEEEVHGKNSKKHAANKKLDRSKNYHRHRDDDEDGKDNEGDEDEKADEDGDREDDEEDREHHVKIMKNNTNYDAELTEMKILTTTTVTGKPKDILKFLNEGVKPYKPAALDFNKKLNSSLFKKIDAITKRSSTSSKSKKETSEEDLTHYIRNIVREGTKKKISKQVDTDKENESDALIARMIEGGINLGIDAGLKIIKISIFVEGKIVWIDLKVPAMFMWSLTKIPFKVIIRLAWKLTRKPLKLITPKYLQTTLKQLVDDYKMKNKMRKIPQSRFLRMKVSKLK